MNNIFDSHAHYDDSAFDADREELLKDLPLKGVCNIINNSCDLETSRFSAELARKYDYIYAAVGIHPEKAAEAPEDWRKSLIELSKDKKVVAIGEIGLDYHYDEPERKIQKEIFSAQLDLAEELKLPVIIHDREAHGDIYDILRSKKQLSGVIHCFSGSIELARETVNMGMYIGLGGVVTFKNAKTPVEVAKYVPLDRLLLETDAPYMAPVPFRGKRCDSSMIAYSAVRIAEIKNITAEEVVIAAKVNAERLFLENRGKI